MIQTAGIVPQSDRREPYKITTAVELQMGETEMVLFPDDGFKISCTSADKRAGASRSFSASILRRNLGARMGGCADVLFLRRDRIPHQER
jgi:hypothetical protein